MDNEFSLWVDPFEPIPGATGTITATTGGVFYAVPSGARWAEVKNNGSAAVRVGFGIGIASIPLTNAPTVAAGTTAFIRKPIGATHIGFRADAGTSVTYTMGNGNSQPVAFPSNGTSPWLHPLEITPNGAPLGVATTIYIEGATAGSVLSVTKGSLPSGLTLNSAARTISGTRTGPNTPFTLTETLAGAQNSPNGTAINILDVATGEPPKLLNTLVLNGTAQQGVTTTLTIGGRTPGSTLTLTSESIPGMTFNAAAGTFTGAPATSHPGTASVTITETLIGYVNSPKINHLSIEILPAPIILNNLALSPASIPVGAAATINITGKTAGSTLTTSTLMPTGMTFTGTQITGTPTAAGPVAIVIIETLASADNSPKSNALTITVTE